MDEPIKESDGWWFRDWETGEPVGPYDTKTEAKEEQRRNKDFYRSQ